jgi:hypothetical protein
MPATDGVDSRQGGRLKQWDWLRLLPYCAALSPRLNFSGMGFKLLLRHATVPLVTITSFDAKSTLVLYIVC